MTLMDYLTTQAVALSEELGSAHTAKLTFT